jgi:hypothetical protein
MLVALLGLLTALVNAPYAGGQAPIAAGRPHRRLDGPAGAPIMAVLFVLFPRFSPLWGIQTTR